MSELKAYVCGGWSCEKEAYPKDDVDKVIADKDKEIAELKDKLRHYPMMVTLLENDKKEIEKLKKKLTEAK